MNANFPFAEFDPLKLAKAFQPVAFDYEAIQAAHQRNVETLKIAGEKAGETFQAIATRQAEILRQGFEEATEATHEVLKAATPEESAKVQVEMTRKAVESQMAHAREIADLAATSGGALIELINARFVDGVAEFQAMAKVQPVAEAPVAKAKRKAA